MEDGGNFTNLAIKNPENFCFFCRGDNFSIVILDKIIKWGVSNW